MRNIDFYPSAIDAGGCISNGWNLVKANYGMYLGISLLAMLMAGCIPCISIFLFGPVVGGVYFVYLRVMRGEPVDFGMMFKGFDKFGSLMAIGIIQQIPAIIGQILRITVDVGRIGLTGGGRSRDLDFFQAAKPDLAIATGLLIVVIVVALVFLVFSIIWHILMFFAIPLAMENNLGVGEALKLSARAGKANVGGLILLAIFEGLLIILGMIALCIGIFFVMPLLYAANAFAYRQVFPLLGPDTPQQPAYGTGFGSGM